MDRIPEWVSVIGLLIPVLLVTYYLVRASKLELVKTINALDRVVPPKPPGLMRLKTTYLCASCRHQLDPAKIKDYRFCPKCGRRCEEVGWLIEAK